MNDKCTSWTDSLNGHFLKKPFRISLKTCDLNAHVLTLALTKLSTDVIDISVSADLLLQDAHLLRPRVETCLKHWVKPFWRSKVPLGQATYFDCGDIGSQNAFSMDGPSESMLIPDIYAFDIAARIRRQQTALEGKDFNQFRRNWNLLNRKVFWRGSTTGYPPNGQPAQTIDELSNIPRVSICLHERFNPMADIKISHVVQALLIN